VTCGENAEGTLTSTDTCGYLTAADIGDGVRAPQMRPGISAARLGRWCLALPDSRSSGVEALAASAR
jgi:hypothetical protein